MIRTKSHLKLKIFMNNVTSCLNKQREVCSDSISGDYEKSLACFWLLYSIFGPLGQTASKPVSRWAEPWSGTRVLEGR